MEEGKFEDGMQRLEEIVKSLEGGDVSLDSALKLYEEGQKLLTFLKEHLSRAETKLKDLTKKEEGFTLREVTD